MNDRGFVVRGRAVRQRLDALVTELRQEFPDRYISRESVARVLLEDGVRRIATGSGYITPPHPRAKN